MARTNEMFNLPVSSTFCHASRRIKVAAKVSANYVVPNAIPGHQGAAASSSTNSSLLMLTDGSGGVANSARYTSSTENDGKLIVLRQGGEGGSEGAAKVSCCST